MKSIWEKIFSDNLFEGIRPNREQRKKMYDRCYHKVKRQFKKEGQKPTKEEMFEELHDCLTGEVYEFQFHNEKARKFIGTVFSTEKINEQKEAEEFEEDVRRLGRINRDFWNPEREDRKEERNKENKKLKDWIENKVRSESNYNA